MTHPSDNFKFKTPTSVTTLLGQLITVQANAYRLSKESEVMAQRGNPAFLRYYEVTYPEKIPSDYLNEIELIALIGIDAFSNKGE